MRIPSNLQIHCEVAGCSARAAEYITLTVSSTPDTILAVDEDEEWQSTKFYIAICDSHIEQLKQHHAPARDLEWFWSGEE